MCIRDRYPGESKEIWIMFRGADGFPQTYGLNTGKYKIRFRAIYRWYKHFDDYINMWMGNQMYVYDQPFTVEESARKAPIEQGEVVLTDGGEPDKLTRWIHTFEEFMTAFDCHISKPSGKNSVTGTLYLQTAPWTCLLYTSRRLSCSCQSYKTILHCFRTYTYSAERVLGNRFRTKMVCHSYTKSAVCYSYILSVCHHRFKLYRCV